MGVVWERIEGHFPLGFNGSESFIFNPRNAHDKKINTDTIVFPQLTII